MQQGLKFTDASGVVISLQVTLFDQGIADENPLPIQQVEVEVGFFDPYDLSGDELRIAHTAIAETIYEAGWEGRYTRYKAEGALPNPYFDEDGGVRNFPIILEGCPSGAIYEVTA